MPRGIPKSGKRAPRGSKKKAETTAKKTMAKRGSKKILKKDTELQPIKKTRAKRGSKKIVKVRKPRQKKEAAILNFDTEPQFVEVQVKAKPEILTKLPHITYDNLEESWAKSLNISVAEYNKLKEHNFDGVPSDKKIAVPISGVPIQEISGCLTENGAKYLSQYFVKQGNILLTTPIKMPGSIFYSVFYQSKN